MDIYSLSVIILIFAVYRVLCGIVTYKAGVKIGSKKYFWLGFILGSIGVYSIITEQGFSAVRKFRYKQKGWDEESQWMCPKCERLNLTRDLKCKCGYTYKEYKAYLENQRREKYYRELNEKKNSENLGNN